MAPTDLHTASTWLEQGRAAEAVSLLEPWVQTFPAHAAAHALLARAYEATHQWDQAYALWQKVQLLVPGSPTARAGVHRTLNPETPRPAETGMTFLEWNPDGPSTPPPTNTASPFFQETPTEAFPWANADAAPANDEKNSAPSPNMLEALEAPSSQPPAPTFTNWWQALDPPGTPPPASSVPEAPEETSPPADADPQGMLEEVLERLEDLPDAVPPAAAPEPETGPPAADDLDRLIEELESAPRITPRIDLDDIPTPELDVDIDDMVSETLARIYSTQQQFEEAARVYDQLARQQPERSDEFLAKAAEMRERAS